MTSCSVSNDENAEDNMKVRDLNLNLINISLYRSDSHKVQPELIIAESDPSKLSSAEQWTKTGTPESLPPVDSIDRIYIFQFQYSTNTITENVYYMYVTDTNKNQYLKKIDEKLTTDLDSYDSTQNELILKKVGLNEWHKVSPSIILTS